MDIEIFLVIIHLNILEMNEDYPIHIMLIGTMLSQMEATNSIDGLRKFIKIIVPDRDSNYRIKMKN